MWNSLIQAHPTGAGTPRCLLPVSLQGQLQSQPQGQRDTGTDRLTARALGLLPRTQDMLAPARASDQTEGALVQAIS